ncbi:MAG: relaxase/mobilization nuclease domain-containing protein [Thiomonas sp.]|nr:relaxase/mobilization nuclease domain-containing protein [Thiomonas sp.]
MLAKVIARKAPARGFGEAVRYIARDRPNQAAEPRPEMGTLGFACPLDTAEDKQTAIAILDATAAAARRKTGSSPVHHVTLAWQEGEHPTAKQIDTACAQVLGALGFEGHEALWALHRDTEHDHVHLIVNRVHPDGSTAKVPRLDWLILDQAMREIEIAQGWRPSPGPYVTLDTEQGPQVVRMSRAERRERGLLAAGPQTSPGAADAAHREAGASFQAWAAGGPAKAIKAALDTPGATWERLHQQAARYGLRIEPKGSGMVVTTRLDDGRTLAAKASQLGRWASKAELEKRLGPWQPPPDKLPAASVSYQKSLDGGRAWAQEEAPMRGLGVDERMARRMERAAARKVLAARFKAEQDTARQDRPKHRAALVQQHRAERVALTVQLREERKALTAEARQGGQLQAVGQSLWALKAAQAREALQKRQAAERKALSAKLPKQEVWRKWVEREAAQGDEAAQATLRGIRYREQRKRNQQIDGIEGEELDPLRKLTLAGLEAQIDPKRQLVLYRDTQGQDKFTDTGPRIVMHDKGADSLEAALRMAAQKYGGKVDITGSAEFRERAARQAVRLGIEVVDADLQAIVQDEQQRRQRPPQLSPTSVEKSAPDAAKSLKPQDTAALPEMRAVDAALTAWQQAQTDAARSRAVQDWMHGMARIEKMSGDVAAANAHTRKALGERYAGFMREVGGLARQRDIGHDR